MSADTTQTPVATDARGKLLDEIRTDLDKLAGENRYYGDSYYLREGTTRFSKFLDSGIVGYTAFFVVCGTVAGFIAIDPKGVKPFSENAPWMALVLAVGSVVTWALARLYNRVVEPKRLRFTTAGHALLEEFLDARNELVRTVESGSSQAQPALDAVKAILPGFEELLIEHSRFASTLSSCDQHLSRRDYVAALEVTAGELYEDLLDITTEATAAARVAYAKRHDLMVAVPEPVAPVDIESLRVRTDGAQQRLAEARVQLASFVEAANL